MRDASAVQLIHHLREAPVVLAPRLLAAETGNALWKYLRSGSLDPAEAPNRLSEALTLADRFEPDEALIHEALFEAKRWGHPVYDLLYLTLARRHGASLLTQDQRLAGFARELGITVPE
jgi:predicted nucleic acid-binding protein